MTMPLQQRGPPKKTADTGLQTLQRTVSLISSADHFCRSVLLINTIVIRGVLTTHNSLSTSKVCRLPQQWQVS